MCISRKSILKILVFIGFAYLLLRGFGILYTTYVEVRNARLYTPLDADVVLDLCARLQLSKDEKICSLEEPVYAIHFNYRIDELQHQGVIETHSDWHALLEPYEKCLPLFQQPNPIHNYFICRYDIGGNKESYFEVWFTESGDFRNIFYRSPYGSE